MIINHFHPSCLLKTLVCIKGRWWWWVLFLGTFSIPAFITRTYVHPHLYNPQYQSPRSGHGSSYSRFVDKLKELTSVLSSVLIQSFRLLYPVRSCGSLRAARCVAFDQPVWHRGDALFCWAHAPRECTVFSMDTISYHARNLTPTVLVNGTTLAFSFWQIFISTTACALHLRTVGRSLQNHHRSSIIIPSG